MMKIGYFADGPWSHNAIQNIVDSELFKIVFIVPRYDRQDPVLKGWAEKLKIPFLATENVNSEEFILSLDEYKPDLMVSMSFDQILKKNIINYAPKGFINCHAGALPFYRGRNPLNWVLINGEDSFGITVHYIDQGIDTGDIIEQRKYPITLKDSYGSLLNTAVSECANVLISAMEKISKNDLNIIKQKDIHPIGTYFGMRTFGDEVIDFSLPAMKVFNFIRAISSPGPGARFWVNDIEYAIEESSLIANAPVYTSTIGEVIGKDEKGVVIKVGDSSIYINKIRKVKDKEMLKLTTPNFRIGTRLSNKPLSI